MGVLVGTSLIVIIPEGVETLYSASEGTPARTTRDLKTRSIDIRWSAPTIPMVAKVVDSPSAFDLIGPVTPASIPDLAARADSGPPKTPTEPGVVGIMDITSSSQEGRHWEEAHTSGAHAWIGVSLIMGFVLMYLIDQFPQLSPAPVDQHSNIYSLSDLSSNAPSSLDLHAPRQSFSTTLGLIIHAAADGIALGASSTQPSLSFVIFFAIMVHKAPAAFGLTTILLRQGLTKRQARLHLAAFSLAAPAGAFLTWVMVKLLGGMGAGGDINWWTGIILLFSGGTFL